MARLVIEGETMIRHDDGPLLLHTERTVIDGNQVEAQLVGIGPGCEAVGPVIATHEAVIAYEREKAAARERSAYINRPITTRFKEPKRKRHGHGLGDRNR